MENCPENVWNFLHIHVMCNLTLALWENFDVVCSGSNSYTFSYTIIYFGTLFAYPLTQNEGWIGNNFKLLLFDDYPTVVYVFMQAYNFLKRFLFMLSILWVIQARTTVSDTSVSFGVSFRCSKTISAMRVFRIVYHQHMPICFAIFLLDDRQMKILPQCWSGSIVGYN